MVFQLVVGLLVLLVGAEALIRGSVAVARRMGVPPLILGLTLVALGTSAPEILVTARAALEGSAGLAVGNVVGSNIFNVLMILGVAAAVRTLAVSREVVRRDVPILMAVSLFVWGLAMNGTITRGGGLVLLVLAAGYVLHLAGAAIRESGLPSAGEDARPSDPTPHEGPPDSGKRGAPPSAARDDRPSGSEARDDRPSGSVARENPPSGSVARENPPSGSVARDNRPSGSVARDLFMMVGGAAGLALGAWWTVAGASALAAAFGVPEHLVGLTVVAAGTSLPELATSVSAALRGQGDLAVGNVVGSNILNLLLVLGIGSVLVPIGLPVEPSITAFDLPLMLGVAVALLPIAATGHRIDRWEGGVFLAYWIGYVGILVAEGLGHPLRDPMWVLFLIFLLPLTLMTGVVVATRVLRARGSRDEPADGRTRDE